MSKNAVVLIPVRLASTRFPMKPLVKVNGKTIIEHCYDWASEAGYPTYVVSGDQEIIDLFPDRSIKTFRQHNNGTERCLEALISLYTGSLDDVIVNVQGDILSGNPEALRALVGMIRSEKAHMATVLTSTNGDYRDSNTVKGVVTKDSRVLFFTRHPVLSITDVRSHVGIYAMSRLSLLSYGALGQCDWEKAESLEQMRWLYHGYQVRAYMDNFKYHSINVVEDINKKGK